MKYYLSTNEAAEYCNLTYNDIVTLFRYKAIPVEKKGVAFFVDRDNLDEWLKLQKKHKKVNKDEYKVKIVSGKYRCSWCEQFRNLLKKETKAKLIIEGSCFSYSPSRKY